MKPKARVRRCRGPAAALAAGILALTLTACGEDEPSADDSSGESSEQATGEPIVETSEQAPEESTADADTTGDNGDGDSDDGDDGDSEGAGGTAATGPITVENLSDRCDELTGIVTTLRGEAPAEVEESEATDANFNGLSARTAHCTYAYPGDSFSDKNRVDIYAETSSDTAGLKKHWDEISATERIPGVGDDASWYFTDAFDAKSSARALVGSLIISVRVTVPTDQADAAYLKKGAAVTALKAVVGKL